MILGEDVKEKIRIGATDRFEVRLKSYGVKGDGTFLATKTIGLKLRIFLSMEKSQKLSTKRKT